MGCLLIRGCLLRHGCLVLQMLVLLEATPRPVNENTNRKHITLTLRWTERGGGRVLLLLVLGVVPPEEKKEWPQMQTPPARRLMSEYPHTQETDVFMKAIQKSFKKRDGQRLMANCEQEPSAQHRNRTETAHDLT